MFTVVKLLLSGGVLAGNARAKYLRAKRSALAIMALAIGGSVFLLVGAAAAAVLVYMSLAPHLGALPAASTVAAALLLGGAVCGFLVYRKIKGITTATLDSERQEAGLPVHASAKNSLADDPVAIISRSLQSPYVISALVVGVLAGRHIAKK